MNNRKSYTVFIPLDCTNDFVQEIYSFAGRDRFHYPANNTVDWHPDTGDLVRKFMISMTKEELIFLKIKFPPDKLTIL